MKVKLHHPYPICTRYCGCETRTTKIQVKAQVNNPRQSITGI